MVRNLCVAGMLLLSVVSAARAPLKNPHRSGLPEYGIRDCHIIYDRGVYYLTGTEISCPGKDKEGIYLYASHNMRDWKRVALLVDRQSVSPDSWYRDAFDAPEINRIAGKYVLSFGGRNDERNPYGTTDIAIAVSDHIKGPYRIVTETPLVRGNRITLLEDHGKVYAYWESDGQILGALVGGSLNALASEPVVIAAPYQFRRTDRFLDSPSVASINGRLHLFYTVFMGGYYAAYLTSDSPLGPWSAGEILFRRTEDQAPTLLSAHYSDPMQFRPPCEIIGKVQFFRGRRGKWYTAYHSEDKYSEPFLCIDQVSMEGERISCGITLP